MSSNRPIVICFDMDGTLLDGSGEMHPNDRAILKSDRQFIFIPATGRSLESVRILFQHNELFGYGPLPIPLILQNGSLVYLPGEKMHAYRAFPPKAQERLMAAMLAEPKLNFWLFGKNFLHTLWPTPFGQALSKHFDLEIQPFPHDGPAVQYSKIIALSEDPRQLADFASNPALEGFELSFSRTTLLEINPAGVNKGTALADLVRAMGLVQPQLYVAGDGGNDLPMFELSEHSFAPLNAQPQVRERASHVIDAHTDGLFTPILNVAENNLDG